MEGVLSSDLSEDIGGSNKSDSLGIIFSPVGGEGGESSNFLVDTVKSSIHKY
jgi:hypothetical protein